MPDDRLGDLGAERRRSEELGDRLAELDVTQPEERPPSPPQPGRRYPWAMGLLLLVVVLYVSLELIPGQAGGPSGSLKGLPPGTRLPAFAAPLATGRLEGDANVRQSRRESEELGRRPACEVRGADVVNMCELRRRPVVLTWVTLRAGPSVGETGGPCVGQLETVERVRREIPGVRFVGVVSGDPRAEVASRIRGMRLGFPVAVDRDNAIANLYRIGICPTTSFAFAGGRVEATRLGPLDAASLRSGARRVSRARR